MAIAAADLHQAVVATWTAGNLDAEHTQYWNGNDVGVFPVLHDMEATPGQPFPYTVFEQSPGDVTVRMTGHTVAENHIIHDVPWNFRVHASQVNDVSAKTLAVRMAEKIIEVFGGHPTIQPLTLTLDNGSHLITQYQTDYGVREDDENHQWIVSYLFRLDVPLAV